MRVAIAIGALLSIAPVGMAESIAGIWNATLTVGNNLEVPFRIEFQGDGSNVKGTFFNGDQRFTSTSGRFENGSLVLNWDYYASKLEATLKNGILEGQYTHRRDGGHFRAQRFTAPAASNAKAPSIDGIWELDGVASSKGEQAWRFIVHQSGGEVSAAILRVDGDTGTLTGTYRDGKFVLSHFSGVRPALLEVQPAADGTLQLVLNGKSHMTAVRPVEARAKGLPAPDDPLRHTGVKDASEPLRFSFPDLNGHIVSETDAQFRGKVVLVEITGSWCPNCHDEAPFLVNLYRKYHSQGLEIVALDFEEAEQLKDPVRLRAFIQKYGIDYTVLLGGETGEAKDKLSQAEHWDAWPTTFFVGRDGKVKTVHSGFPSKASAELYTQAADEFTHTVEHLLAESTLASK
jgi:thiol-disulfide isomerase/thioredoxin